MWTRSDNEAASPLASPRRDEEIYKILEDLVTPLSARITKLRADHQLLLDALGLHLVESERMYKEKT